MDNQNERCEIAAKDGVKAVGLPVEGQRGRLPEEARSFSGASGIALMRGASTAGFGARFNEDWGFICQARPLLNQIAGIFFIS